MLVPPSGLWVLGRREPRGGSTWGFGEQSTSQSACFSGGPDSASYQRRQKHSASRPGVRAGSSGRD